MHGTFCPRPSNGGFGSGANVCSKPVEVPAAARAQWLAEVADTLAQAGRILDRLKLDGAGGPVIVDLEQRIAAATHELELLRLSRSLRSETDPTWTNLAPWQEADRGF